MGFSTLATFKINGELIYITEHRKLIYAPVDDSQIEEIKRMTDHKGMRLPYTYDKMSNDLRLKINLQKYDRPRVKFYEQFLGEKTTCCISLCEYDSPEYGHGYTFQLRDIYRKQNNKDE